MLDKFPDLPDGTPAALTPSDVQALTDEDIAYILDGDGLGGGGHRANSGFNVRRNSPLNALFKAMSSEDGGVTSDIPGRGINRLTGDTLVLVNIVTVRDLRNNGGDVLRRVEHGERIVVTRDGAPVAELRPLPRPSVTPAELIRRRKNLPPVNPDALRRDTDNLIDPSL
jgi:prevent-host-death family protein